jgi:hyperosmotically inducible protein
MATATLSGCAVAMLGGAARSGSGASGSGGTGGSGSSGSASSSTSGGRASTAGSGSAAGTAGSGGATGTAGRPVSDSSIATAVRSRLGANSSLKALKIVVDTHDGIVTLRGQVNTLADKSAAQAEARAVSGVKGVNNQLTVR